MQPIPSNIVSDTIVTDTWLPTQSARRAAQLSVGLYSIWTLLTMGAHGVGAVVLEPGSGLILLTGVLLTTVLFLLLGRLPAVDQPSLASMITAQSVMGIVWTTLYSYFAKGDALLTTGMYVSAVLYPLPYVAGGTVLRLGLTALAAAATSLALATLSTGMAPPLDELAALGSLAAVLALAVTVGLRVAADRNVQDQRYDELRLSLDRVSRRADRDHLTNSYTRRFIVEMMGREKARSDRTGEPFCVLLLDIDHFKSMNDRHGHLAGDRILASFARRVRTELRDMDSMNRQGQALSPVPGGASLGRYGGEEFIVILPHTVMRGALRAAERIRKAIVRQPFDGSHQVTVSIGIAEYRAAESVSDLLARADEALYGAKNAGRNRVHCATRDGGASAVIMPEIPKAS